MKKFLIAYDDAMKWILSTVQIPPILEYSSQWDVANKKCWSYFSLITINYVLFLIHTYYCQRTPREYMPFIINMLYINLNYILLLLFWSDCSFQIIGLQNKYALIPNFIQISYQSLFILKIRTITDGLQYHQQFFLVNSKSLIFECVHWPEVSYRIMCKKTLQT